MGIDLGTRRLDDVWAAQFVVEPSEGKDGQGRLYRRLFQPERDQLLEINKQMRLDKVVEDRDWRGRWCLSIPLQDYEWLLRQPEWKGLGSTNNAERQETWRRFLISEASAPYRVRDNAC